MRYPKSFVFIASSALLISGGGSDSLAAPGAAAPLFPKSWSCEAGSFNDGRFNAGGVELAYTEGPRTGPTILFIPGMGVPRASYRAAASRLCNKFHVVVLDQRGQGESAWAPDHRYRVVDYGRDAARFIEGRLSGGPVIVSGHSVGGLVALWLASEHPELVSGLNLEDNPFLISERGRWEKSWVKPLFVANEQRLRAYRASGLNPAVLRQRYAAETIVMPRQQTNYADRVRTLGKFLSSLDARGIKPADAIEAKRLEAGYRRWLNGERVKEVDFVPASLIALTPMISAGMDPDVVHAAVTAELNDGFAHRAAMAKVKAPTLYWNSDEDLVGVISQDEHDENARILGAHARVRHVVARNIGHLIHAEAPDLYAREIADFFGK